MATSTINSVPKFLIIWLTAPSYRHRGYFWRLSRWPTFRDLFTAIYIVNPSLTPVEKLFHLNSKTSGEAHSIVSRFPLTNDGFRSAWNNLTERFENKRLQVNRHLKTLFNVQSIAQVSGAARTFQGCLTFLKFSGVNIENWDPILVYMCSTKLPNLTLSLWEQSIQEAVSSGRCLHLARLHCRPLSLSISPLSLRSALERLS